MILKRHTDWNSGNWSPRVENPFGWDALRVGLGTEELLGSPGHRGEGNERNLRALGNWKGRGPNEDITAQKAIELGPGDQHGSEHPFRTL